MSKKELMLNDIYGRNPNYVSPHGQKECSGAVCYKLVVGEDFSSEICLGCDGKDRGIELFARDFHNQIS